MWLCYSIYNQIQQQQHLQAFVASLQEQTVLAVIGYLLIIIILTTINWGLEAAKWKLLTHQLQYISFKSAYAAVLTGQALSFSSINRVGESIGKSMLLSDGNRLKGVVLSFVGSASQLLITLFAGLIAASTMYVSLSLQLQNQLAISATSITIIYVGLIVLLLLFLLCYAAIPFFANKIAKFHFFSKYAFLLAALQDIQPLGLIKLVFISAIRYLVFLLQYLLIFKLFQVNLTPTLMIGLTAILFLTLAIIPTLTLAELGIRGKVSLFLFGLYSSNELGILASAGGIWLLNLIVPACLGGLILLRLQYFRKRS